MKKTLLLFFTVFLLSYAPCPAAGGSDAVIFDAKDVLQAANDSKIAYKLNIKDDGYFRQVTKTVIKFRCRSLI